LTIHELQNRSNGPTDKGPPILLAMYLDTVLLRCSQRLICNGSEVGLSTGNVVTGRAEAGVYVVVLSKSKLSTRNAAVGLGSWARIDRWFQEAQKARSSCRCTAFPSIGRLLDASYFRDYAGQGSLPPRHVAGCRFSPMKWRHHWITPVELSSRVNTEAGLVAWSA